MTTLFFILLIVSAIHLVYEGIVAPSLRHNNRYKFFELRDRLRRMKIEDPDSMSDKLFRSMDSSICNAIRIQPYTTISAVIGAKMKSHKDEKLARAIIKRNDLIENSANEDVLKIHNENIHAMINALMINSGMMIVYFLPFAIAAFIFLSLRHAILRLVLAPSHVIDELTPQLQPDYNGPNHMWA